MFWVIISMFLKQLNLHTYLPMYATHLTLITLFSICDVIYLQNNINKITLLAFCSTRDPNSNVQGESPVSNPAFYL